MEEIRGLKEYIASRKYREALGLPEEVEESYRLLVQGEYNRNYYFEHPSDKKRLVLRVNLGSQMHLEDQIGYEYNALKLLESSGRTPKPLYVDGSKREIDRGIMVMEFLPGEALDYRKDLYRAAPILGDIHRLRLPREHGLLIQEDSAAAVLDECREMFRVYRDSPLASALVKSRIERMMERVGLLAKRLSKEPRYRCCINTELNSGNFLIGEKGDYLVDWEKPVFGEPAQDLGHFLAPTTSFWKTDVILERRDCEDFLSRYIEYTEGTFENSDIEERVQAYIPISCMRGISWCAMAWVQYKRQEKLLRNEFTAKKLDAYLSPAFLDMLENEYIR